MGAVDLIFPSDAVIVVAILLQIALSLFIVIAALLYNSVSLLIAVVTLLYIAVCR